MERMTRKECERCQSWIDRDVGCIAKVCPRMTTAQAAIELTGVGAMVALSGVDRRLIQRIHAGQIVPHQGTAYRIAAGRRAWLRQRLERKVDG